MINEKGAQLFSWPLDDIARVWDATGGICGAGCNQSDVKRAEEKFMEIGAPMNPLPKNSQG
ncbi:MAG: hypothetical protein F4148_13175 [Caldilineaceae bacterium SB0675_bin_29]|uniref:Uncharacterized protein n=1 Tax=Caldilineaceae bacterium SB0675_bin_29 TaxID=2605266 RepID=A0A6B1FZP0_9CHLR|nr:hypothetical protein [Caldilineaceae bacterium SB0675_bin_29]